MIGDSVLAWLLDSDPSIRWQALQVTDAAPAEVAAERTRVATEGWGADLLALQDSDGRWDGGTYRPGWAREDRPFFDAWTATHFTLQTLRELGVDPEAGPVRAATALVREHVRWEHKNEPYFDGEIEPCINGVALANAVYFGQGGDAIVERLLARQLDDGGWNCYAEWGATVSSFHSTICVLEGLVAWASAGGHSDEVRTARRSAEEYLLERSLYRRRSDGAVADPRFTMLSQPVRWYYDVLRGLEYFRAADRPDARCADAVELVRSKRGADGRWRHENTHDGPTLLDMNVPEKWPSRWITLRAERVLRWWDQR